MRLPWRRQAGATCAPAIEGRPPTWRPACPTSSARCEGRAASSGRERFPRRRGASRCTTSFPCPEGRGRSAASGKRRAQERRGARTHQRGAEGGSRAGGAWRAARRRRLRLNGPRVLHQRQRLARAAPRAREAPLECPVGPGRGLRSGPGPRRRQARRAAAGRERRSDAAGLQPGGLAHISCRQLGGRLSPAELSHEAGRLRAQASRTARCPRAPGPLRTKGRCRQPLFASGKISPFCGCLAPTRRAAIDQSGRQDRAVLWGDGRQRAPVSGSPCARVRPLAAAPHRAAAPQPGASARIRRALLCGLQVSPAASSADAGDLHQLGMLLGFRRPGRQRARARPWRPRGGPAGRALPRHTGPASATPVTARARASAKPTERMRGSTVSHRWCVPRTSPRGAAGACRAARVCVCVCVCEPAGRASRLCVACQNVQLPLPRH